MAVCSAARWLPPCVCRHPPGGCRHPGDQLLHLLPHAVTVSSRPARGCCRIHAAWPMHTASAAGGAGPSPSLLSASHRASMLVNMFKFRNDIQSYSLGGMGCGNGGCPGTSNTQQRRIQPAHACRCGCHSLPAPCTCRRGCHRSDQEPAGCQAQCDRPVCAGRDHQLLLRKLQCCCCLVRTTVPALSRPACMRCTHRWLPPYLARPLV